MCVLVGGGGGYLVQYVDRRGFEEKHGKNEGEGKEGALPPAELRK
jgi:hypothetical protein